MKKAPYKERSIKTNELKQITDIYNIHKNKRIINIFLNIDIKERNVRIYSLWKKRYYKKTLLEKGDFK
ncbi:hypothetical protein CN941_11695 [Bacillus cereus]|nr:hypothetical protein CN428_03260 [Bacillus cereus]PEZ88648.1 hypothetical protein CN374_15355 [Bacillus cereus]PFA29936.1 hypothetical protein CN390_21055 [Bacillus cereus]PFB98231.1 hypothetical protein CN296_13970 [Bacillus cereus]PFE58152.1 hypothetical protein CN318_00700 [Bacillus cereus]